MIIKKCLTFVNQNDIMAGKGGAYMKELEKIMLDYRARENLSQTAAAEQAGISYQTWCMVENGNQKPSRLTETKIRKLCERKEEE